MSTTQARIWNIFVMFTIIIAIAMVREGALYPGDWTSQSRGLTLAAFFVSMFCISMAEHTRTPIGLLDLFILTCAPFVLLVFTSSVATIVLWDLSRFTAMPWDMDPLSREPFAIGCLIIMVLIYAFCMSVAHDDTTSEK